MSKYPHIEIEKKWQAKWAETGLFRLDTNSPREKYYCLMMYPYPSGELHVGHGRNYVIGDALARFKLSPQALFSVMGRHLARALETRLVAEAMAQWVLELKPGEPAYVDYALPEEGQGMGLVGAPRGALGHWIEIKEGKIANYQCVVPTTWNLSARDDREQPGPAEQSLIGAPVRDSDNPFEAVRIVRSFDPCLACAVH